MSDLPAITIIEMRDGLWTDSPALWELDLKPGEYTLVRTKRITDVIQFACPFCDGAGVVPEQHEPWATEYLGCQECRGEGTVSGRLIVEDNDE